MGIVGIAGAVGRIFMPIGRANVQWVCLLSSRISVRINERRSGECLR